MARVVFVLLRGVAFRKREREAKPPARLRTHDTPPVRTRSTHSSPPLLFTDPCTRLGALRILLGEVSLLLLGEASLLRSSLSVHAPLQLPRR